MEKIASGYMRKMHGRKSNPVDYSLPLFNLPLFNKRGDKNSDEKPAEKIPLNAFLGKTLRLHYQGDIKCIHCGRKTNKSFNQGYCYPCLQSLAQCDVCIIQPEKCHYDQGTCREPEWGDEFCMQDHIVYLANSSGVKVGITRASQIPTRWIDQGAVQALPIMRVKTRQQSGYLEVLIKQHVADKTNWRVMLKGEIEPIDLSAQKQRLLDVCAQEIGDLVDQFGLHAINVINGVDEVTIDYPVIEYPQKITSLNFDKEATVEGVLLGIKGQYLIFDTGVINIRKFAGYNVDLYS